jgi:hypothetical protein
MPNKKLQTAMRITRETDSDLHGLAGKGADRLPERLSS